SEIAKAPAGNTPSALGAAGTIAHPGGAPIASHAGEKHVAPAAAPEEETGPVTVPDAAKAAAEGWFAAYVRGDVGWMAGWSAAPFTAGGQVAAKDGTDVKRVYQELIKEAGKDRRF